MLPPLVDLKKSWFEIKKDHPWELDLLLNDEEIGLLNSSKSSYNTRRLKRNLEVSKSSKEIRVHKNQNLFQNGFVTSKGKLELNDL